VDRSIDRDDFVLVNHCVNSIGPMLPAPPTSSDAFEPVTAGSTKPIAQILRRARIVKAQRFSFGLG